MQFRRTATILVMTAVLLAMPAVSGPGAGAGVGGPPFSGVIYAGHPGTYFGVGVTEIGAACQLDNRLNQVDGEWFHLGHQGLGGKKAFLNAGPHAQTSQVQLDVDAQFFDERCDWIDTGDAMASKGINETEVGIIPAAARWLIVNGYEGSGTFVMTIADP